MTQGSNAIDLRLVFCFTQLDSIKRSVVCAANVLEEARRSAEDLRTQFCNHSKTSPTECSDATYFDVHWTELMAVQNTWLHYLSDLGHWLLRLLPQLDTFELPDDTKAAILGLSPGELRIAQNNQVPLGAGSAFPLTGQALLQRWSGHPCIPIRFMKQEPLTACLAAVVAVSDQGSHKLSATGR